MKDLFKKYFVFVFAFLFIFAACEDRTDLTEPPSPNLGTINFDKMVSLGNSLTAGFMSNALYENGQVYSYGSLISKQVKSNYQFPNVSEPGIGGRIEVVSVDPFKTKVNIQIGTPTNTTYPSPYNNLGVPGAFTHDILNATSSTNNFATNNGGTPNPFFDIVLRGIGTPFSQAKMLAPSIVTLWIGNNDLLSSASTGGEVPATPVAIFEAFYKQLLDSVATLNCPVFVANIAPSMIRPFYETVGNSLKAGGFVAVYGKNSSGDTLLLNLNTNYLTLRALEELFDSQGNLTGKGTQRNNPLSNRVIIDSTEFALLMNTVSQYNSIIAAEVAARGFHLVDINSLYTAIDASVASRGFYEVDGIKFNLSFVSGGLVTLDGVHPTAQAHGIIANKFIETMNQKLNISIPKVNVANLPGSLIFAKGMSFNLSDLSKFKYQLSEIVF